MTERDLHDMGGNIGPASDRAASAKDGDATDSAPQGGYAQDVDPSVVGEATQNTVTEGSDRGGSSATPPVAGAPSEYVSIDETQAG